MPREPIRFIHAANLDIDHPLDVWGELPDEVRPIVENATTTAFRNVVAACLERDVDFLLLAGNAFNAGDCSLAARTALRKGLSELSGANIRVFVMAGRSDPPSGWRSIVGLPQNVTLFAENDEQPVAVLRDGKVIATVTRLTNCPGPEAGSSLQRVAAAESAHRGPYTIAFDAITAEATGSDRSCPRNTASGREHSLSRDSTEPGDRPQSALTDSQFEYLALGGPDVRRTITTRAGLAHHPGSSQGHSSLCTGPRGCTLVEMDAQGTVECTFVRTAPVRWEQVDVEVAPRADLDALIREIDRRLLELRPEPAEKTWLIRARLTGSGPLLESLGDDVSRREFVEKLNRQAAAGLGLPCAFWLRLLPDAATVERVQEHDPFSVNYFGNLDREQPVDSALLKQYLHSAGIKDTAWLQRLESLVDELDTELVAGQARSLGIGWFGRRADSPAA